MNLVARNQFPQGRGSPDREDVFPVEYDFVNESRSRLAEVVPRFAVGVPEAAGLQVAIFVFWPFVQKVFHRERDGRQVIKTPVPHIFIRIIHVSKSTDQPCD